MEEGYCVLEREDLWILLRCAFCYAESCNIKDRAFTEELIDRANLGPEWSANYWWDGAYSEFERVCPEKASMPVSWPGWLWLLDAMAWRLSSVGYPSHGASLGLLFESITSQCLGLESEGLAGPLARGWSDYKKSKGL